MKLKKTQILNIIYYFFLCLFILFGILKSKLGNMDELWNFLFAKNISNGLLPYKDFNIIITPLSMFINSIFLYFKPILIIFRILYFLYYLIMLYIINKITKLLNIKSFFCYVLNFSITLLLCNCYLDYNFIQLIMILLLIYLSLRNEKYENERLNILISLIAGLTIINKQSTGLIICFVSLILFYLEKRNNLRFIRWHIVIMLIPSFLFLIYLLLTNSLFEFIDFCILGLFTFSNNLVVPFILFILILSYIVMIILLRIFKCRELIIIFYYSIANLIIVIPIVDFIHGFIALITVFIFFIYILNKMFEKNFDKNIYFLIIIFIIMIFSAFNIYSYITSLKIKSGVYINIPCDSSLASNIKSVNQYVEDNSNQHNIYILDYIASLYNINMNKYNKYFDLFMNGNLGINGKKEMYKIINKKNQIILINRDLNNWQCPNEIINYVLEKYNICGSIEQFDIYCN